MRVKHGLIGDAIGLLFIAIPFAILMFLVVVELLFSVRARVELGEETVAMTLPAGRGPTPLLRYKSYVVPYATSSPSRLAARSTAARSCPCS